MRCPECNHPLLKPSAECPACGHHFGVLTFERLTKYFEMKSSMTDLEKLGWTLQNGLKQFSSKLIEYENLLNREIRSLPRPPVAPPVARDETAPKGQADTTASTDDFEKSVTFEVVAPAALPLQKTAAAKGNGAGKTSFEAKLGERWLLIIGIVTMVLGVGFFLKYSFEMGWVGPAGRVASAYLWGGAMLAGGNLLMKRGFPVFGLYLIGGAIAVLYSATTAGFQLYGLFGQGTSFFIMVLITAFACALSIYYDTKWLAVIALIGGFLTPVLLSTGTDNQLALMTYMTILNAGLLTIGIRKKWDLLNTLGFVFTYILFTAWFAAHYEAAKFPATIFFLTVFYLIYSVLPFASHFVRATEKPMKGITVMAGNSLFAFAYSYYMIEERYSMEWVSAISVLYAAVFGLMATYLYRSGRGGEAPFTILIAKASLFLIITIPLLFSGEWITVFWAAQALTLLWAGLRLSSRRLVATSYLLFLVAIFKFLAYDYSAVFHITTAYHFSPLYTTLIVERYITTAVLLATVFAAARMATVRPGADLCRTYGGNLSDGAAITGAATALLFIAANFETSAFFHDYLPTARFAAISVLWSLFAAALMALGFKYNQSILRICSIALFLVTLMKVGLFDISRFSTPYRILSFLVLGSLLIAASYLYHKFKETLIDDRRGPAEGANE